MKHKFCLSQLLVVTFFLSKASVVVLVPYELASSVVVVEGLEVSSYARVVLGAVSRSSKYGSLRNLLSVNQGTSGN